MIEINKLYLDDCRNILPLFDNESVDLIVSDIPYRIISGGHNKIPRKDEMSGIFNRRHYDKKKAVEIKKGKIFKHNEIQFLDWLPEIYRITKDKAHIYLFVNDRNLCPLINNAKSVGLKLLNILIWQKDNAVTNKYYMKNAEFIVLLRKGGDKYINDMGSKACFLFPNVRNKQHPTEKPLGLLQNLIRNSSNEGELVVDMFNGTGNTCLAAKILNRNYVGIEIDEKWHNIAVNRLANGVQKQMF